MIKLLCRICRLSWFQDEKFKEIIEVITSMKTNSLEGALINFVIFNELIYEFQLIDIPPKNKYLRLISEFKDTALLKIYEFSTKSLLDIFSKEIKFEKLETSIIFIQEISKSLIFCFEFDDNSHHDKSDKYFIVKKIIKLRMFLMCRIKTKDRKKKS